MAYRHPSCTTAVPAPQLTGSCQAERYPASAITLSKGSRTGAETRVSTPELAEMSGNELRITLTTTTHHSAGRIAHVSDAP